jgi:hypothetical protein
MAKHSRVWNRSVYEKYLREGRGRGDGPGYTPWIRIQDFASKGVVSRVKGRKSGRVHHLMSNNELAYFYLLDWSDNVLDIREQYPLLDLDCAMNAATGAGIKYPTDKVSGYPYVMTCDFLITTAEGLKARTVKLSSELNNPRTIEKLEVERRYWNEKGIEWKLVTESEISFQKAENIEFLYAAAYSDVCENIPTTAVNLLRRLYEETFLSVTEISKIVEREFFLRCGLGLMLFKYLALNKIIAISMNERLNLNQSRKVEMVAV